MLECPIEVTVQQGKVAVYLPELPFCALRTYSSEASV